MCTEPRIPAWAFTIQACPSWLVRYLSTRIAVMEKGRLVEIGEAEALGSAPQMPYTQRLLAATPELPAGAA